MSPIHISRSLFQDIEGGEDGEAGDPPFRVDQQTLRVWADGRPHRVNIPLKYQVCRQIVFLSHVFRKDQYGLSGKDLRVTPMLDWVYGYRGKDSRANLAKLPTGEVSRRTFQLLRHIFSTEKKKITRSFFQIENLMEKHVCLAVHHFPFQYLRQKLKNLYGDCFCRWCTTQPAWWFCTVQRLTRKGTTEDTPRIQRVYVSILRQHGPELEMSTFVFALPPWPTYTVRYVSSGTPVCHWAGSRCRGRRLRSCPGLPIMIGITSILTVSDVQLSIASMSRWLGLEL